MTYQELITELQKLTKDQLDCDLTVRIKQQVKFTPYLVWIWDDSVLPEEISPVINME